MLTRRGTGSDFFGDVGRLFLTNLNISLPIRGGRTPSLPPVKFQNTESLRHD